MSKKSASELYPHLIYCSVNTPIWSGRGYCPHQCRRAAEQFDTRGLPYPVEEFMRLTNLTGALFAALFALTLCQGCQQQVDACLLYTSDAADE